MSECDEPTTIETGHTGTASTDDPAGDVSFGADFDEPWVLVDSNGEAVQENSGLPIITTD